MSSNSNHEPPTAPYDCILMRSGGPVIGAEGAYAVARRPPELDLRRCPSCEGNAHLVETDARGYRMVRPCRGALRDARIDLFNHAHLPGRYHAASLSTFEPRRPEHPQIIDTLERYLAGFEPGHRGRLFAGSVGTGKTHLLVACLRYLTLQKGIPCGFVEFSHLLGDLRRLYAQGRSEAEILAPLGDIPVLAIDELGKGRSNEFELRIIDELISRRYNDASVTTFFASNYMPSALSPGPDRPAGVELLGERIGARAESRIYEMCEFTILTGTDYRRVLYREGS